MREVLCGSVGQPLAPFQADVQQLRTQRELLNCSIRQERAAIEIDVLQVRVLTKALSSSDCQVLAADKFYTSKVRDCLQSLAQLYHLRPCRSFHSLNYDFFYI